MRQRTQLPHLPEGELPRKRTPRGRRVGPAEQGRHPTVAHHIQIIDRVRAGEHLHDGRGDLTRRAGLHGRAQAHQPGQQPIQTTDRGEAHHRQFENPPGAGGRYRIWKDDGVQVTWIDNLLQPGRELRSTGDELLCALGPDDRGSPYNRRQAAMYDRVVGSGLHNRLLWGVSPKSYGTFAQAALVAGQGPLLDVGCGSAVFTAAAYRTTERPLVLVDRSLGMLARAAQRLLGRAEVVFVQADLFDLPFLPGQFTTVACHGLLHLFDDVDQVLLALRAQVAPGGSLYVTSLVAETVIGSRGLGLLHRAGEAAVPRRQADLVIAAHATLGDAIQIRREGSMLFLSAVL